MLLKAILINLVLLGVYCTLITAGAAAADRGFSIAIVGGICIAMHVGINIIAGLILLVMGKGEAAKALLISGAILAPVGFVSWLILLSIFG
ncbi:MAG: hypothetical protein WC622_10965 [Pedobacter sp.]|jgi:hypothetical protein|uniref:hypothetical protein n=1 Tax=Pedobacter sp. TaxID=1411316 RepID=UPI00356A529B